MYLGISGVEAVGLELDRPSVFRSCQNKVGGDLVEILTSSSQKKT